MILRDREIRAALGRQIYVFPEPSDPTMFSSSALDLTLDARLLIWKPGPSASGAENSIRPTARRSTSRG